MNDQLLSVILTIITAATPPRPSDTASVAAHSLRDRSVSNGRIASYFSLIHSTIFASGMDTSIGRYIHNHLTYFCAMP